MKANLDARIMKLEQVRRLSEPAPGLVLCGLEDDVEAQLQGAIADGRYRSGDPLMTILLVAPDIDEHGQLVRAEG